MLVKFTKMHGLGNDFAIFDFREGGKPFPKSRLIELADRKRGIGCDQIIFMLSSKAGADVFLDMYNADGSALEACGNATRCIAKILMDDSGKRACVIETIAGKLFASSIESDLIQADMGIPRTQWNEIPLLEDRDTLNLNIIPEYKHAVCVNVGNPHAIFFVDDISTIDLEGIGPKVENHTLFPKRTNVEFAQILSPDKIRMRVWERGAGVTQACGSGACATIVAAVRRNLTARKAEIILDGGSLFLEWREEDNHILMTGPATYVYQGIIEI